MFLFKTENAFAQKCEGKNAFFCTFTKFCFLLRYSTCYYFPWKFLFVTWNFCGNSRLKRDINVVRRNKYFQMNLFIYFILYRLYLNISSTTHAFVSKQNWLFITVTIHVYAEISVSDPKIVLPDTVWLRPLRPPLQAHEYICKSSFKKEGTYSVCETISYYYLSLLLLRKISAYLVLTVTH